MDVLVEYATKDDLSEISKVFQKVLSAIPYYNKLAKEIEEKKYAPGELSKKLEEDPKSIITIKVEGVIAGFCFSRFDDFTIWLEWFGIAQAYRGKELSRLLLLQLEQAAKERNCHKIWCDSRTENLKSISILQKNGYENIALLRRHWYSQDFFLWQKFID